MSTGVNRLVIENLMMRVDELHSVLAALIHAHVDSDPQASPDGFRRARELGLIEGVNPGTTPLGRGVLQALGYRPAP